MDLLSIIIAIAVVGVILWALNKFVPMAPNIKNLLNVAVVIILVVWLLQGFGFFAYLRNIRI